MDGGVLSEGESEVGKKEARKQGKREGYIVNIVGG